MNGMKNIAEYGKKPLRQQLKPVFFPVRKIFVNFALAKDRQKQRSCGGEQEKKKHFWK